MDGDDGAETARCSAGDDDVLVLGPGESFEYPVRIRHGLATHKRILRGIGDDGSEVPALRIPFTGGDDGVFRSGAPAP